jgi:hypothetical protein
MGQFKLWHLPRHGKMFCLLIGGLLVQWHVQKTARMRCLMEGGNILESYFTAWLALFEMCLVWWWKTSA